MEYKNIFINAFKKCELEKRDCLTDLKKILEKLDNYDLSMKIPNESTNINSSFEQFFNFSDPYLGMMIVVFLFILLSPRSRAIII